MSILDTALDRTLRRGKPAGKHRARSLREENIQLLNRQAAADDYFALLMEDRDQVYACWQKAAADRDAAEQLAACLAEENVRLHRRLAPFEAAEANKQAVTVPPMVRDTSAMEDQATEPIPVKTLREAFGPVIDPRPDHLGRPQPAAGDVMSSRETTCIVIDCDVCHESFDTGDHVAHFATADQGIKVAIDSEWTDLGGGRLACDRSDAAHDDARDAAALAAA